MRAYRYVALPVLALGLAAYAACTSDSFGVVVPNFDAASIDAPTSDTGPLADSGPDVVEGDAAGCPGDPAVTRLCSEQCTDISTSKANCGGCGSACVDGVKGASTCAASACTCATGNYCPTTGCVDFATSLTDCGACGNACETGATCTSGVCLKSVAQAGVNCALAVAVTSTTIAWSDFCSGPAVKGCPLTGCVGTPTTLIAYLGGRTRYGIASATSGGTGYIFTTDNNYSQGLSRVDTAGAGYAEWGSAQDNAGPIASDGTTIVFADQGATYRAVAGTSGVTKVMNIGGAHSGFLNGPPIATVAIDAASLFVATPTSIYRCAVGGTCTGTPAADPTLLSAALSKVLAISSDGTKVYASGGTDFNYVPGVTETIYSVPVAGGTPTAEVQLSPAADGGGTHLGLIATSKALYWGSLDGGLYRCDKANCSATKTAIVPSAKVYGLAQDANYIYWINHVTGAAMRTPKI